MKKYLLSILGLLIFFPFVARDFSYTYDGKTLTYSVLDESIKTCEVKAGNNASGNLTIPEIAIDGDSQYSVVAIGHDAFFNAKDLTSVTIPKSVTDIFSNPFLNSASLNEIIVDSENPNFISDNGALYNKELTKLLAVGGGSRGQFVIPNSVTQINQFAFGYCDKLKSVTIPNSIKYIGLRAFLSCCGLTSLTIPASVTLIEPMAFDDCRSLTEIKVSPYNPNYASFEGALYNKRKTDLIAVGGGKKDIFVIPDFVNTIKDYVFYGCHYLTSITIPGSVSTIGKYSFDGCDSLTDINVAPENPDYASLDGVLYNKSLYFLIRVGEGRKGHFIMLSRISIDELAFYNCNKLTSLFFPDTSRDIYIDDFAFENTGNLKRVYCAAEIPPSCSKNGFGEKIHEGTLYVPVGAKSVYEQADPWRNFKNIVEFDFAGIDAVGAAESSLTIKIENGRIFVVNKPAESAVKVYSLLGRMVAQTCGDEIVGLPSGIYIVIVGTRSFKVIL